ncbi:MAG TPA: YebC/PmpR family DNA-binding transcriptional regulator [Candidatus Limnocylindrales bacterium]|nr:YebC/PmpR family DNA-binding transcriptional regulator [Candidatus Limnocylindrales bacterium]
MSGHSKWSTIKHKKAAKDAKRGKVFTKLIREITVAARMGGADASANPRLRTAIAAAKAQSMPNENIERAVKKGAGGLEGDYQEATYEGYGPGGMAVMLEALTDNKNRTVADLRNVFQKHGGNLGEANCVRWMFERVGQIVVANASSVGEEHVFELALEAGATDIVGEDDALRITIPVDALEDARASLEAAGIAVDQAEITLVPQNTVRLAGADAAKAIKLIEALEDHDDVQRVSANFDIDEDELSRLSA